MRAFAIPMVLILLSACGYDTQTISGRDRVNAQPPSKQAAGDRTIDAMVRVTASIEPTLRFPARIGIARIDHGHLSPMPPDEAQVWSDAAANLGGEYDSFVPVSPLVAAMFRAPRGGGEVPVYDAVDEIRLAAARQHLDAALIYETDATSDTQDNPLSIADWTLIGAFVLPGRDVKAQGVAQAMLIDVRNGYPYGTVSAKADDKGVATAFHGSDAQRALANKVRTAAVVNLGGETVAMFRKLKPELAALDRKPKK
jgi:hypothetical protein